MMSVISRVKNWGRSLMNLDVKNTELDEEMEVHLAMKAEQYERNGMSSEQARKTALREFGNVESLKEDCRDSWGTRLISEFLQDIRYGWRQILKHKGFSAIVIITFVICIGLNAVMIGIFDSLFLNPNLYPNEDRIVRISDSFQNRYAREGYWLTSPLYYLERKEQSELLEDLAICRIWGMTITDIGDRPNPERVFNHSVSPSLFSVLGVKPYLGRVFTQQDVDEGNTRIVILNYNYWQSRFQGDKNIIGRQIELDRTLYTIIGVMPKRFSIPSGNDAQSAQFNNQTPLLSPWVERPWHRTGRGRQFNYVTSLGLLRENVTIDKLHAELSAIGASNGPNYPEVYEFEQRNGHKIIVNNLRADLVRNVKTELMLLQAALGIIFLMGSINVSSLILSRNRKRLKEFSTRVALGASRLRLIRQILVENCIYGMLGGIGGLIVAAIIFRLLSHTGILDIFLVRPRLQMDTDFFAIITLISISAGVLSGLLSLIPIFQQGGFSLAIREDARTSSSGSGFKKYQTALTWAQIALCCFVLIAGGLLLKSFWEVLKTDPGFNTERIFTASFRLMNEEYDSDEKRVFMAELKRRVAELSDVESVGLNFFPPLKWGGNNVTTMISERDWNTGLRDRASCISDSVDTSLFETLSIPVIRGRNFDQSDLQNQRRVVIIDQQLAQSHFPGIDPLGQRIALHSSHLPPDSSMPGTWYTIIGVVGNVTRSNLVEPAAMGTVYRHINEYIPVWASLVVKTRGNPYSVRQPIREILDDMDPRLAMIKVESMRDILDKNYSNQKHLLTLVVTLAALALGLCAIGLYGVISYLIASSYKEIGIRIALGARVSTVQMEIIRYWMMIASGGIVCGLVVAAVVLPGFEQLLYRVNPYDAVAYGVSSTFFMSIVLIAAYLSARRATRINPVVALRAE